eukprot:scaffold21754_cov17-Prasinocladus_malaysianus.AAC.1
MVRYPCRRGGGMSTRTGSVRNSYEHKSHEFDKYGTIRVLVPAPGFRLEYEPRTRTVFLSQPSPCPASSRWRVLLVRAPGGSKWAPVLRKIFKNPLD